MENGGRALKRLDFVNTASLIAGGIFSAIGLAAFIYGKKQSIIKPMLIGSVLMIYPYLITDTARVLVIGVVLTAALFIFHD